MLTVPTRTHTPRPTKRRTWLGLALDLVVVATVVVLVVLARDRGRELLAQGVKIFLGWPPLLAGWFPRIGPGTAPAIVLALLVVVAGPNIAARLRWGPLLGLGYVLSAGWTLSLATIDGWKGVAKILTDPKEYLNDVDRVGPIAPMLREFTSHISVTQPGAWSMHVGAHPPGAFLFYVVLDKLGLGYGGAAGTITLLIGASAVIAVAVTLRALCSEELARRFLPFGVLFPGAVWVGVSADGMFAGVLAWGVALLALGCTGTAWWRPVLALPGGLLLGYTLFLSYGLAAAGLIPLVVLVMTRRWLPALLAVLGAAAVVFAFDRAGFWWFDGFELVKPLYYNSVAKTRPYDYFVWANIAALAFALGPAVFAGLRRAVMRPKQLPLAATLLIAAAVIAVAAADYSGFSKAEVERIWLPFGVWILVACTLLPRRTTRFWLASQAVLALLVNHLLFTVW